MSTVATQALQKSSSIVTVNNTQINADIDNANNETIADQTKERQVYVGISVTRGDIPTAEITSTRGPNGIDGKTTITMFNMTSSYYDKPTSQRLNIPICAVDSYTGVQTNGNAIHRVTPNGVQTNNIGTTKTNNIGQESLNHFIEKQKNP